MKTIIIIISKTSSIITTNAQRTKLRTISRDFVLRKTRQKHGKTANSFIMPVLLSNSYVAPLSVCMVVLTLFNLDYLNI